MNYTNVRLIWILNHNYITSHHGENSSEGCMGSLLGKHLVNLQNFKRKALHKRKDKFKSASIRNEWEKHSQLLCYFLQVTMESLHQPCLIHKQEYISSLCWEGY